MNSIKLLFSMGAALTMLSGCAVVSVASTAVTLGTTAVSVGVSAGSMAVGAATSVAKGAVSVGGSIIGDDDEDDDY